MFANDFPKPWDQRSEHETTSRSDVDVCTQSDIEERKKKWEKNVTYFNLKVSWHFRCAYWEHVLPFPNVLWNTEES